MFAFQSKIFIAFFVFQSLTALAEQQTAGLCPHLEKGIAYKRTGGEWVLQTPTNFLKINPQHDGKGSVFAVVEIPAGCNDKWEVKKDGRMVWDKKKGRVRFVQYLSYPGNYGMIPGTLSGDGDPLDIMILGNSAARGSVHKIRVIGVLEARDGGEPDDKLLAVFVDQHRSNAFANVKSVKELPRDSGKLIEQWFANYKPAGKMKILGLRDAAKARKILKQALQRFVEKQKTDQ